MLETSPNVKLAIGDFDLNHALFVHFPEAGNVPMRYRTYRADCLLSALGRARSVLCHRSVSVVLVCSRPPEDYSSEGSGINELNRVIDNAGDVPVIMVSTASEAARLVIMAGCKLGGIMGVGATDELGAWAVRVSGGHCYSSTMHQGLECGQQSVWSRKGDLMSAGPMLDIWSAAGGAKLEAARANMAGCAPIVWINLDRKDARREHIELQLRALGVRWHRRVRAIDGSDLSDRARRMPSIHPTGTPANNACTASHVLAMATYLEEFPEEPWVVVLEDDASFEFAPEWPMPLRAYIDRATAEYPDWRVVQLGGIICDRDDLSHPTIRKDKAVLRQKANWFSTVAYAIRREAAVDIVRQYYVDGQVNLGQLLHDNCACVHPEVFIYSQPSRTLFAPLFSFIGTESDITAGNPIAHSVARGYLLSYWKSAAHSDP